MSQLIDFIIYCRILFDIGIGCRNVSLGLIIVVIGYEIFNRIFRKKLLKLRAQLRCKGFIMGKHKRRTVELCNNICHCKGLARACNAEQGLFVIALVNSVNKLFYCSRLVARRLIFGM